MTEKGKFDTSIIISWYRWL